MYQVHTIRHGYGDIELSVIERNHISHYNKS